MRFMRSACFRRIRLWPPGHELGGQRRRGVAGLMVIFMVFVFSGIGLGMLLLSQSYLRMNGYRKFSVFMDYASENGIKRGLRDLAGWLESSAVAAPVSAGRLEEFREDPAAVFPRLLEEALGPGFPRRLSESADGMSWESLATCGLQSVEDRGDYARILAGVSIESSGAWSSLPPKRKSVLEGTLGLLAGYLPLPSIPLLINKEMTEAEKAGFLAANGISLLSGNGNILAPSLAATGSKAIPKDAARLAGKALDVRLFTPQDLTPVRLREALGLEASADPVPDGVYLIKTDLGLGGVFVQGDADEVVLAIDGDAQAVVFRMAAGEWLLEFSPARSHTDFLTPEAAYSYDFSPLGIIIFNGKVGSLGGGVVAADGTISMAGDEETPSILGGVSLTIVSSDRITLSSHLIMEGARWQEGIPYVKESQSQLVIFSTGRDFVSQEETEGGIAVGEGAPDDLKIQASVTSGGGDFEIQGSGKTVEILGALHAAGYKGNGNSLRLAADERLAGGGGSGDVPLTTEPKLTVYSLKILTWKEHE